MNTINDGIKLENTTVRSILMIGQSNMAGRGDIGDVPKINNNSCFMLRNGRWQKMHEPINPDRPIFESKYKSGIGLAASFADDLNKSTDLPIGLIPCADGGTSIEEWQKGGLLFDHAVMQAKLAMRTSHLSGIIWHQGENNCISEESFEHYRERFIKFVADMRESLGMGDIPFVAGELSRELAPETTFGDRPERFNALLHELEGVIPNFTVVSSLGLPMRNDGLHFNAAGQRQLGHRYFEAFTKLGGLK